jgi:dihydroorotate dehydrogenase electron transfer subunit
MARFHLPCALKITGIMPENATTKTFSLAGRLTADPGQFVMAWLPGFEDKPFSLAGADPISLTVAAVGPFSRAMHRLEMGDNLWVRGPLGRGYHLPGDPAHLLLIGGGYGVAPLLFLARRGVAAGHRVSMIIGARSSADLLLAPAFEALGSRVWLTTEDGSAGQRGRVTDAISRVLAEASPRPSHMYACGPTGMLRTVAAQEAAATMSLQLAWEAHMRCGVGLCGSCEVGQGWLTCLDGPVFQADPVVVPPA